MSVSVCDYKMMRRARSLDLRLFTYGIFQYFFSIYTMLRRMARSAGLAYFNSWYFSGFSVFFSIKKMMRMRARSVGLAPADNRGVMAAVLRQAIISISALFKNVVA